MSGIHGKEEREAINAARRIVQYQLEVATWLILNESNAEGELASSLGSDEEPTVAPVITSNQGKRPAGDKAFAAKKQRVGVEEDSDGAAPVAARMEIDWDKFDWTTMTVDWDAFKWNVKKDVLGVVKYNGDL